MNKENILSKIGKMSEKELKDLARSTSDVETLKTLAENANYEVRCTVAENKNTPVELLAVLAQDEDYWVRWAVALNKNTPIETLVFLSKDNNEWVSERAEEALKERTVKKEQNIER